MALDISTLSIGAIATVVAAVIGGALSFISLTLTKEQKISEFRQEWIDGLREDLAFCFAASRSVTRAFEFQFSENGRSGKKPLLPISDEKIGELRHEFAETFYRVKLRLNPEEPDHNELIRLINVTITEQNNAADGAFDAAGAIRALETAVEFSRPVLKAEWRRVKSGELPFRLVRNWLAPAVIVFPILFLVLLWSVKIKT